MRGCLPILFVALLGVPCAAQDATVPPTEMKAAETFFSGSVVAVSSTEITVRRRALISNATTKAFAMDADTKIEGKVRVKATVTIRYVTDDEGQARAIQIIVR